MYRIILFLCAFSLNASAQTWTWMSGTDTANVVTGIGSLGVPGVNNRPGSMSNSARWTDLNGNLWVFSGFSAVNYVSDLWKFNVSTNEWTLVRTNGTVFTANYGTLGVGSTTNNPSARQYAATWTDSSGDLWLYGGFGFTNSTAEGYLSDLWKYNIATNQWTWVNGSSALGQSGVYGTQTVTASTNKPGGRYASSFWSTGNTLWLYGGSGISATSSSGYLGDLWKYDIVSNQWTWMTGSSGAYPVANQGTQGFPSTSNTPGARSSAQFWKDNTGNFWISGGNGVWSGFGTCTWGDMWKYDVATNLWVWLKGPTSPYLYAQYGTLGAASSTTDPGARTGSATWVDAAGDFWLFGGNGYYASNNGPFNDLWKYTISTNNWTWMKGPSGIAQAGNKGTKFFPASTNNPEFRTSSAFWKDINGNLWLFGGENFVTSPTPAFHYFADVWRLSFCTIQPATPTNLVINTTTACASSSVALSVNTSTDQVFWTVAGTSSLVSGPGYTYTSNLTAPGNYTFYAQSVNMCTASIPTSTTLTIYPTPTLSVNSTSLCAGSSYTIQPSGVTSYTFINGSTVVTPTVTTSYTLTGNGTGGCLSNTAVCTISVLTLPVISINSGSMCEGTSFTLNPSGASSYTFPGGSSVVAPFANTSYTVAGTGANGCTNFAVSGVTVIPSPTLTVNSGSVCSGSVFTLSPSGAISYTYSAGSSTTIPLGTTTYSVFGVNANGCVSSVVSSVAVLPNPTVTINSGSICAGSVFTLSPSGAISYTLPGNSFTVSPATSTVYTVEGVAGNGCKSNAAANVSVSPLPVVTAAGGSICQGDVFTIVPLGASTFTFSGNTALVSPSLTSTYSVTGTSSAGCISAAPAVVQVTVLSLPVVTISSGSICAGSVFSLVPSGAFTYSVSGSSFTVSPSTDTQYTVTGTGVNGCTATAVSDLTVYTNLTLTVNSGSICAGSVFTLNASGALYYTFPGNSSTVAPLSDTTYMVTGFNTYGCSDTVISSVSVLTRPLITVAGGSLCAGESFTLSPTGALTYTFSSASPLVSPTISTSYSVSGTGTNGCVSDHAAIAQLTVSALPDLSFTIGSSFICAGETHTIQVSGANTYTWNTGTVAPYESVSFVAGTVSFTVTGESTDGCVRTESFSLYADICAGIVESLATATSAYPNPFDRQLTLQAPAGTHYRITNALGQQILQGISDTDRTEIEFKNYDAGWYILEYTSAAGLKTMKLLKQ